MVGKKMAEDGSCSVVLGISLSGDLASTLYKRAYQEKQADRGRLLYLGSLLMARFPDMIPAAEASPVGVQPDWSVEINKINRRLESLERLMKMNPERVAEGAARGEPTGLIIDARGTNFTPSLAPRVRRVHGGVIYPGRRHQHQARESGRLVSLFMNDLLLAQGHPRVGERPLVLKALRSRGKGRTELVLGKSASSRLQKLIDSGFLEVASVIVVLD